MKDLNPQGIKALEEGGARPAERSALLDVRYEGQVAVGIPQSQRCGLCDGALQVAPGDSCRGCVGACRWVEVRLVRSVNIEVLNDQGTRVGVHRVYVRAVSGWHL